MDDSPSDYINIPIRPDNDIYESQERDYQAHELLTRNERYMTEVKRLRSKYGIAEIMDSDNPAALQLAERTSLAPELKAEIQILAKLIQRKGFWYEPVKNHIMGYEPSLCLYPEDDKRVLAKIHDDNIELRIFGDVTQPELRSVLGDVRDLISQTSTSKSKVKKKYRLNKNLVIYDLWKLGMSYSDIAIYCKEHGLQSGLSPEDVSKYIQLTRKQIEQIVA